MSVAAPPQISDELATRAHDLLEQGRVCLVDGYADRAAVVAGATGWYCIRCTTDAVTCDCQAGTSGALCSHALAAMMVWGSALEDPFGGSHEAGDRPW